MLDRRRFSKTKNSNIFITYVKVELQKIKLPDL